MGTARELDDRNPQIMSHIKNLTKFLFPFIKNERSRLSLRYQLPEIANKHKQIDLISESPSLYTYKKKLKEIVLSAYSSGD